MSIGGVRIDGVYHYRRSGGGIFDRGRTKRRAEGPAWIPERFWARFGQDTAIVDTGYDPPVVTTYAQLGERKRREQAERLRWKRQGDPAVRRPLYVWVFHCPGIFGFAYFGWWCYLIGRGIKSQVDKRDDRNHPSRLRDELRALFPFGERTLYGDWSISFDTWMERFARAYCCRHQDGRPRKHAGRIQGKAFVWAEVNGDHVSRLLGRIRTDTENE